MKKIFKGIYSALVMGLLLAGLAWDIGNFQAMIPTLGALAILAVVFSVIGWIKSPTKKT